VGWGLATRLSGVAAMLVAAAAYPLAVKQMEAGDVAGARGQLAANSSLLLLLLAPAGLAFWALAPLLVPRLVAAEYQAATLQILPWALLGDARHQGVQRLVRDLNQLLRTQAALHHQDSLPAGFEWLSVDNAEESVLAWCRYAGADAAADVASAQAPAATGPVLVVCNFTPVPRPAFWLGVPDGPHAPSAWREALNTDSAHYGGSNVGNAGAALEVQARPAHGRQRAIQLVLPPLATLFLVPA
jgi:1,4-alpha-glucan branching enzyme